MRSVAGQTDRPLGKRHSDTEKVNTGYYYFIRATEGESLTKDKRHEGQDRYIQATPPALQQILHTTCETQSYIFC